MKKIIGTCILWLMTVAAFAQNTGTITYEVKMNMHRRIPEADAHMKNVVPEYMSSQERLYFTETESYYKAVEQEEEEGFENGGGMVMRFRRPTVETYTNVTTSERITFQDLMGKNYLIQDTLKARPWKIEAETEQILGYTCQKATLRDEARNENIAVWFTTDLRANLGPANFNSLPGAVLKVDLNDGERILTAKEKEFRPIKKIEVKAPTSGEKITPQQFGEKVKEVQEQMRSNGGRMIIRN